MARPFSLFGHTKKEEEARNFTSILNLPSKKEESRDYSSVAAQGVVAPPQPTVAQAPPMPPQMLPGPDPNLQAKAPGYKAPVQRNASPSMEPEFSRAPGFNKYNQFSQLGQDQGLPVSAPPPTSMMLNRLFQNKQQHQHQQQQPFPPQYYHAMNGMPQNDVNYLPRDEYSTPDQPMQLPKIDSNLNPEASEFTANKFSGSQYGPGTPPFHPAMRSATHPAGNMFGISPNFNSSSNNFTQSNFTALMAAIASNYRGAGINNPPKGTSNSLLVVIVSVS
jgi:hypothetical protein